MSLLHNNKGGAVIQTTKRAGGQGWLRCWGGAALAAALLAGCAYPPPLPVSRNHIQAEPQARASGIPEPVKAGSFAPPPKPSGKPQTYSVVVNEVPVKELLFALARDSGQNFDIQQGIEGFVTLNMVNETLPAILERIAKQANIRYEVGDRGEISVMPDTPYLKTYRVDYVNLERETASEIGVSTQITGTGLSPVGGGGQASGSAGANNMSSTKVKSTSSSKFWKTLEKNINDILQETDKERVISRRASTHQEQVNSAAGTSISASGSGVAAGSGPAGGLGQSVAGSGNQAVQGASSASGKAQSDQDFKEYESLFAATVIANPETGVLSVRANSRQHKKVAEFINTVMSFAKRQVLIEATIIEIGLFDQYQAGVDWKKVASLGEATQSMLGAKLGTTGTTGTTPFFSFTYKNPDSLIGNITATVKMLESFGNTKVLSSPKVMALNNQTAILKVVRNLVYFTVTANTTTNQTTTTTTYSTNPNTVATGLILSVTPQVNDNGLVSMTIRPTISRRVDWVTDPNPNLILAGVENKIPVIQVSEMESVLQVNSGQTVVLGGLMQDDALKNRDGIPLLSRLPGSLGDVFGYRDDSTIKTELVIFLRPTVITNPSLDSDELRAYRQYLPADAPAPAAKP